MIMSEVHNRYDSLHHFWSHQTFRINLRYLIQCIVLPSVFLNIRAIQLHLRHCNCRYRAISHHPMPVVGERISRMPYDDPPAVCLHARMRELECVTPRSRGPGKVVGIRQFRYVHARRSCFLKRAVRYNMEDKQ